MPRLSQSVPRYRKHKASGQAFVELNGRRYYLGPHGSKTSRDEYDRRIGEWLQSGRVWKSVSAEASDLLVVELIAAYLKFARSYYRKDGRLTSEYSAILHAMRPLKQLYGREAVVDFGPIALQTVMAQMVGNGWARGTINRQAGRIKRMFKWGVSQELLPASTYHALATVSGLRKGRTDAHETDPVEPVADGIVDATLAHLPEVVADMVRFQRLTGCRPNEVCVVRPCDIDTSTEVWAYRPKSHKTEHHDRNRVIFIGPNAQAVLIKYLARDGKMYCFRPMDSEAKRRSAAHAARRTPLAFGNRPGTNRKAKPKRLPGARYKVDAYRRAIARACDRAFPHPTLAAIPKTRLTAAQFAERKKWQSAHRWSPNQLRHSAATDVRRRFGLEAAQVLLGHSRADVTQVYAERDLAKGIEIARLIG
jgi:integrase